MQEENNKSIFPKEELNCGQIVYFGEVVKNETTSGTIVKLQSEGWWNFPEGIFHSDTNSLIAFSVKPYCSPGYVFNESKISLFIVGSLTNNPISKYNWERGFKVIPVQEFTHGNDNCIDYNNVVFRGDSVRDIVSFEGCDCGWIDIYLGDYLKNHLNEVSYFVICPDGHDGQLTAYVGSSHTALHSQKRWLPRISFIEKCDFTPSSLIKSTEPKLSPNAGNAGNFSVGVFTGQATMQKPILSLGGNKMPLDLSLIYHVGYPEMARFNEDVDTYMPNGCLLNYQYFLDTSPFSLLKPDLSRIEFHSITGDGNRYCDKAGSDAILTRERNSDGSVSGYRIDWDNGQQMLFNSTGLLTAIRQKIPDGNYVSTTFEYYSSGEENGYTDALKSITDGMGRTCCFSYGNTSTITIRCTDFNDNVTMSITKSSQNLKSIVDMKQQETEYSYNSETKTFSAKGTNGEKCVLSTSENGDVISIKETIEKTIDDEDVIFDIAYSTRNRVDNTAEITTYKYSSDNSGLGVTIVYGHNEDMTEITQDGKSISGTDNAESEYCIRITQNNERKTIGHPKDRRFNGWCHIRNIEENEWVPILKQISYTDENNDTHSIGSDSNPVIFTPTTFERTIKNHVRATKNQSQSLDSPFELWYTDSEGYAQVIPNVKDVYYHFRRFNSNNQLSDNFNEPEVLITASLDEIERAVIYEKNERQYVTYNEYQTNSIGNVVIVHTDVYARTGDLEDYTKISSTSVSYTEGRVSRQVNEKGIVTEYYYDDFGNLTSTKMYHPDDLNEAITFTNTYSADGSFLLKESEGLLRSRLETEYEYNNETGFLQSVSRSDGSVVNYGYGADGVSVSTISSAVDENATATNTITYESGSGVITRVAHNGTTFEFVYDNTNSITQVRIVGDEGSQTLVYKIKEQSNDGSVVTDRTITVYGNAGTRGIVTEKDAYGRVLRLSEVPDASYPTQNAVVKALWFYSDDDTVSDSVTDPFDTDADSASLLRKFVDNYEGKTYLYFYDERDRLVRCDSSEQSIAVSYDSEKRVNSKTSKIGNKKVVETPTYREQPLPSEEVVATNAELGTIDTTTGEWTTEARTSWETAVHRDKIDRLDNLSTTLSTTVGNVRLNKAVSYVDRTIEVTETGVDIMVDIEGNEIEVPYERVVEKKIGTTPYVKTVNYSKCDVASDGSETNETVVATEDFTYNAIGNIASIRSNDNKITDYTYDKLNRLVRENNQTLGKTWTYEYDAAGNILSKKEYAYTTDAISEDDATIATKSYEYGNAIWKDQLTKYNNVAISYDSIGNPINYKGNLHTWTRGRLLQKVTEPVSVSPRAVDLPLIMPKYTSFEYNGSGIRTKKVHYNGDDTLTTKYFTDGATILGERIESANFQSTLSIYYIYNSGELVGMEYDGVPYYYRKNALGDIVEIYNASNTLVGSYKYDAWGNCTIGTNVNNIARYNPFRYRGYYYDTETGYYYLQTRYYDPEIGRFINADNIAYLDPKTINGCNLYAYCLNNPIMYYDPSGCAVISLIVSIALGFVIGAGYGAWMAHEMGLSGDDIWRYAIVGGLAGGIMGLGSAWGVSLVAAGKLALGASVAFGTGFVGGFGSNVFSSLWTGQSVDWNAAIMDGVQCGILNVISLGIGTLVDVALPPESARVIFDYVVEGVMCGIVTNLTSVIAFVIDIVEFKINQGDKTTGRLSWKQRFA